MTTSPDLAATERRVFSAFWQDGVLDLLVGAALMSIGMVWLLDMIWLTAIVPASAIVVWPILRRTITEPRLGQVRFRADRRHRLRHGLIAVVSLGMVLFAFAATHIHGGLDQRDPLRWLAPAIPSLLLTLLALSAFEILRLPRLLAYAGALAAAGLLAAALRLEPGWPILTGGAVVSIAGIVLLVCFVRGFPRLPREVE
jgi:hypothetical protein